MALQDRVLLVVHPDRDLDEDNGRVCGFAKLYSAPGHAPAGSGDRARGAGLDRARGEGFPPALAAPHHHVRAV